MPDEALRQALTDELLREVSDGHPLFRRSVKVLNRCGGCDEVLVELGDGDFGLAHPTWSGKPETPPWPTFVHTGGYVAMELAQAIHAENH